MKQCHDPYVLKRQDYGLCDIRIYIIHALYLFIYCLFICSLFYYVFQYLRLYSVEW
jgi:hypothetical protein